MEHKKLDVREVLEDQPVIIVPPVHPFAQKRSVDPRDLEGQVMIMHEEGSVFQAFIHQFREKNKFAFSMPITLSNNEAVKRYVEGGTGIALLSKHAACEEIKNNQLMAVPLTGRPIIRKFYLISHKDKYLSTVVQTFIDMIFNWALTHTKETTPT